MKSKKKSKKAVSLLTRIEKSLSDVLDDLSVIEKSAEKNVRAGLLSAQKSIGSAIDFISALPPFEVGKKTAKSRKRAKSKAKPKKRAVAA
jgi:hypothetical protein